MPIFAKEQAFCQARITYKYTALINHHQSSLIIITLAIAVATGEVTSASRSMGMGCKWHDRMIIIFNLIKIRMSAIDEQVQA